MNKLVFDIGATNIKFAVMTPEGDIVKRCSTPTPHDTLEHYLEVLCALAEPEKAGVDGVAVSTNGRMYPDGDTYRAYTSDFLIGVNLREALESRLHLPVAVENDGAVTETVRPDYVFQKGDLIYLSGSKEGIRKLNEWLEK